MPQIYLGPESLSDIDKAIHLEWIITNGLGGYASSTVLNINARKFHGLLFVAFNPPVSRHLLLSKMDEEIEISGNCFPLNSNEFKDVIYPEGYKNLKGFTLHPFPTFYYQVHGIYVRKEIFMPHLKNMVIINYEVFNGLDNEAVLNVYPLINMRHFYETTNRHDLQFSQEQTLKGVMLEAYPKKGYLVLYSTEGKYVPTKGVWIERIHFRIDNSRGESCFDDNYQPGFFKINLAPKKVKKISMAAVGGREKEEVMLFYSAASKTDYLKKLYTKEIDRQRKLLKKFYEKKTEIKQKNWLSWLLLSADSFIVTRKSVGSKSVIAGYPWFEDWGRDSLISLPGLTLVTGRFKDAEEILLTFKESVSYTHLTLPTN